MNLRTVARRSRISGTFGRDLVLDAVVVGRAEWILGITMVAREHRGLWYSSFELEWAS